MKIRYFYLFTSFLFLSFDFRNLTLINTVIYKNKFTITDPIGNIYAVSSTNDIIKYNEFGEKQAVQNFKLLGNISSIDASNPLELYVFYKDQNRILYLDNMLNYRGESNLNTHGYGYVSAIARSYDNGLWLFDASDMQLKKCNKQLNVEFESGNILQVTRYKINPTKIFDTQDKVYLLDTIYGIFEFDIFGNFNKLLPFQNISNITLDDTKFIYKSQSKWYIYDSKRFYNDTIFNTEFDSVDNIMIYKKKLITSNANNIKIYKQL